MTNRERPTMEEAMSRVTLAGRRDEPFESHYLTLPAGRLHYIDAGAGPPVVMVHDTPTSSYVYRHLIPRLAERHRVVAIDHLGFGLSDKPADADYVPAAHARNLELLIEALGLQHIVLVVHDFGGPIGLSYAIEHAANVRGLVLFNTWMWSLAGTPAERMSRLLSGAFGRFLYTRLNFSPRVLLKAGFANRRRLTKQVHRHYMDAFPTPATRRAPWVLAKELIGSTAWYEHLRENRARVRAKPALLLWGRKDRAFGPAYLAQWRAALAGGRVIEFADAGHFVQEEAPVEAAIHICEFLDSLPAVAGDG
jgi:haloalkane dehalogenase